MKREPQAQTKSRAARLGIALAVSLLSSLSCAQENRPQRPPRNDGGQGQQGYSIEQAISDNAQLHTIAFNGLAFVTGDFGACTFMPPGKVCDFFGFQYMRDIDASQAGHNPKFLSRAAGNIMRMLNDDQIRLFLGLANEQAPQFEKLARMRFPLIKAFCRQLARDVPPESTGLSRQAVVKAVGDIFSFDGEMSYRRAQVMGRVARSLSAEQKAFLSSMKFGDFSTWPDVDEREQMRRIGPAQSKLHSVAFMTYASEFFSWYAGNAEADTYFCPERHGTYFGGFYMKDMPAMGKRDYSISLSRTGDSGRDFLDALSDSQRSLVTEIVPRQRNLLKEVVKTRRAISAELRKFLSGGRADKATVVALCRRYGELDGEMSWMYATALAKVGRTLTADQKQRLMQIRNLDGYVSAPYYLYSDGMSDDPHIPNTDGFFSRASSER